MTRTVNKTYTFECDKVPGKILVAAKVIWDLQAPVFWDRDGSGDPGSCEISDITIINAYWESPNGIYTALNLTDSQLDTEFYDWIEEVANYDDEE